jgi:hypothetical protein
MSLLKFKSPRQENEFNLMLHPLLQDIAKIVAGEFGAQTVTGVARTQVEQDQIYGKDLAYKRHPWQSVHQERPVRGLDLRDSAKAKKLVDWVNAKWVYDPLRPKLNVALLHDLGFGRHVHLQVCDRTGLREVS